jgi:hypothetical protein
MLQNIPKEKILEVVKQGPTIPQKIVKIVGGDTMLIGAILSTMISTGEVRYSILKFGGSPLYYVPEDEPKLEEYINYLNEKDQKTARILKEQKVMFEAAQDPLIKASLKTIKDFAKTFAINNKLFYRYFLADKDESERTAINILKEQERIAQERIEKQKIEDEELAHQKSAREVLLDKNSSALDKEAAIQHAIMPESVDITKDVEPERKFVAPKIVHTREASQKTDFFETVKEHIHKLGLDIVGKEKVKKTEYLLILKNHDSNEYIYCVAKDKKTINEGDLSTAFVFSHQKKMPCMFLMTGKLSKKAEVMTQKEFKDMKIEKI